MDRKFWVIMVGLFSLVLIGLVLYQDSRDQVDGRINEFGRRQNAYLEGRDQQDRSNLLLIGVELANNLAMGEVTSKQATAIESRLDLMLRTMGWRGMSAKDQDSWDRISFVISTRKAQQAQIDSIDKR